MAVSAVIFGGIGALVETSHLQRKAFNDALRAAGADFQWSEPDYQESLATSGGMARLSNIRMADGAFLTDSQISAVHHHKTRRFGELLRANPQPLRTGVATLINHARNSGIKLAWATTTSMANIDAVIATTRGKLSHDMFAFIGNDTCITRQKPDPQIYVTTLAKLAVKAANAYAIEDSLTGVASAKNAGLTTIAFPGRMNANKDFSGADSIMLDIGSLLFEPAL